MMNQRLLNRREVSQRMLGSLLTFSLLETVIGGDCLAASVRPIAANWLADLNRMGRDVKSGRVYVDPQGEQLSGGRIKAAKLKSREAFDRFG